MAARREVAASVASNATVVDLSLFACSGFIFVGLWTLPNPDWRLNLGNDLENLCKEFLGNEKFPGFENGNPPIRWISFQSGGGAHGVIPGRPCDLSPPTLFPTICVAGGLFLLFLFLKLKLDGAGPHIKPWAPPLSPICILVVARLRLCLRVVLRRDDGGEKLICQLQPMYPISLLDREQEPEPAYKYKQRPAGGMERGRPTTEGRGDLPAPQQGQKLTLFWWFLHKKE